MAWSTFGDRIKQLLVTTQSTSTPRKNRHRRTYSICSEVWLVNQKKANGGVFGGTFMQSFAIKTKSYANMSWRGWRIWFKVDLNLVWL